MTRGRLIAFEGDDAAGKRTQSERLAKHLNAVLYSFPMYETETGRAILDNLQGKWRPVDELRNETQSIEQHRDALVRQTLFAINRHEFAGVMEKYLKSGRNVVCDRYWASGYVFGQCDGLDPSWLIRIHEMLPQPDLWLLLDVSPEESVKRRPERRDRYECDGKAAKRRELYLKLFDERASNVHSGACWPSKRCTCDVREWRIVDGLGTIEEVERRIVDVVQGKVLF